MDRQRTRKIYGIISSRNLLGALKNANSPYYHRLREILNFKASTRQYVIQWNALVLKSRVTDLDVPKITSCPGKASYLVFYSMNRISICCQYSHLRREEKIVSKVCNKHPRSKPERFFFLRSPWYVKMQQNARKFKFLETFKFRLLINIFLG